MQMYNDNGGSSGSWRRRRRRRQRRLHCRRLSLSRLGAAQTFDTGLRRILFPLFETRHVLSIPRSLLFQRQARRPIGNENSNYRKITSAKFNKHWVRLSLIRNWRQIIMPRKSRCYMLPVHVARHVYYLHCVSKGVNFMIPASKMWDGNKQSWCFNSNNATKRLFYNYFFFYFFFFCWERTGPH